MIVKTILPRALERLSVIEAGAPVSEPATLMSKPHTDLSDDWKPVDPMIRRGCRSFPF